MAEWERRRDKLVGTVAYDQLPEWIWSFVCEQLPGTWKEWTDKHWAFAENVVNDPFLHEVLHALRVDTEDY
jgi:hypothetical protein